jgi:hypothetical protein
LTPTTISNSDSILGKICAIATITPAGIHAVITNGWDYVQMKITKNFIDGVLSGTSSTYWTEDVIFDPFKTRLPDNSNNLYTIDAPGIIGASTLATDSIEIYENFYDYVTWNSQICCDTNNFWHIQARWKVDQTLHFTLTDLGTNTITLPPGPYYSPP